MTVRATARTVSISAKKLQLVVSLVRGKRVEDALAILRYTPTPAALAVAKVVKSAASNAENNLLLDPGSLRIVGIFADKGTYLRRIRAKARGRAGRINKAYGHITVLVDEEA